MEEEKEEQVQAKPRGLTWCLGILGPPTGVWPLGCPVRPYLFQDTCVRELPGFALDRA